ncbi:BREX-1 system adenine-specific DNA-methyltransferase PglX [Patescibacteria group bacterium]
MNKSILKKFATEARRKLMDGVTQQLLRLNPEKPNKLPTTFINGQEVEDVRYKEGKLKQQRDKLIQRYHDIGKDQLIEEVAYFWFNRFLALRFMEVNGYLDTNVNVLAPKTKDYKEPQLLTDAAKVNLPLDQEQVYQYQQKNDREGLYRYLLITQCNQLHQQLPFLFEATDDYTELLMPQNLLSPNSVITQLVELIPEEDFKQVEIIGWMYQYYISEKKDQVMASKKKVKPEDIPAVTQLFTPHWIVQYLVENSLGRLWMLNNPNSGLIKHMEYYIKPEELETDFLKINSPEEIKICDPAVGSGHMLVYAFELLYEMYKEKGFQLAKISQLILQNNLYGVEIDKRAGQLAAFAMVMKARSKDSNFLRKNIQPNVCVLENVSFQKEELKQYMDAVGENLFTVNFNTTLYQFEEADNFGSLIQPALTNVDEIKELLEQKNVGRDLFLTKTHENVLKVLHMTDYLSPKYHIVIANPPYMGSKSMNVGLKLLSKEEYPDSKSDLFAMFIERDVSLAVDKGYVSMITMQSWMFLSSFEKLRKGLLEQETILSMAHLGTRAFDSIGGAVVSTTAFVLKGFSSPRYRGSYLCLTDGKSEYEKERALLEAIGNQRCGWYYRASATEFRKIPGYPIAYWVSDNIRKIFSNGKFLSKEVHVKQGLATSDNKRFLRYWHEIMLKKVNFSAKSLDDTKTFLYKWYPLNKGGNHRRWYGNHEHVINWENNGQELWEFTSTLNQGSNVRLKSRTFYFRESASWGGVTTSAASARYYPPGFIFDCAGPSIFADNKVNVRFFVGLLNSKITDVFVSLLNPTINFTLRDANNFPLPAAIDDNKHDGIIEQLIMLSKLDWDSYETSWDFATLSLLDSAYNESSLKNTFKKLSSHWREMTDKMKQLEEDNNRIFINAYGLQDELTPEVPLNEITLTCNPCYRFKGDKTNDELEKLLEGDTIKEFISYAIGCMMGRYSLDKHGLILANEGDTLEEYLEQVPKPTFIPDEDGIIPVLDEEYFKEDDILLRFNEFVRVTFGQEKFNDNLSFIAHALGGSRNKTPDEVLRHYFTKSFYKDHVKMYKKRPIYWLFKSGKHNAFSALVYLHRYTPDTIATIRTRYVHKLQNKYNALLDQTENAKKNTKQASEISKMDKKMSEYKDKIQELGKYEQQLKHFADKRLKLDLDDGVEHNYLILEKLLAKR